MRPIYLLNAVATALSGAATTLALFDRPRTAAVALAAAVLLLVRSFERLRSITRETSR
jgi:hypothetical protein